MATPNFEALSYVWGSQDDPSYVYIGTESFLVNKVPITRNLDNALRHLRYEHEERAIWIDALCIDQKSVDEKGKQVAIMGTIYALASRVIVWLGPDEDKTSKTFGLLRQLAHHVEVDWINSIFRPSTRSNDPTWADLGTILPYRARELDNICKLLSREYFERTWTRQEIALGGKHAVVQSGHHCMPWKDFKVAIGCVFRKGHHPDALDPGLKPLFEKLAANAYDLCDFTERKCDFTDVRMSLRTTLCTDSRDKLYSVLSLLKKKDQELGIVPDYSRSVEDVYTDVSRTNNLKALAAVSIVLRTSNHQIDSTR
jgi:hypothetical protein